MTVSALIQKYPSLGRLAELKQNIKALEKAIKDIMPDAINEALNNFGGENAIVYSDSKAKIVLKQVKEYDSPKTNGDLFTIDFEIKQEIERLERKNAIEIKLIDSQIKELQAQRENLLTSDKLTELKAEYEEVLNGTLSYKPQLAVTLK